MLGHRLLRAFFAWFALVCVGAIITAVVFNPFQYYGFIRAGVQTMALVTDKEPENHGLIHYSYVVEGKTYSAVGHAGYGNPYFKNIEIGQEIIAFYDPRDPSRSILGNPKEHFKTNLEAVLAGMVLFPILVLYVLFRRVSFVRHWLRVV
jgi:hypothetical protein